MSLLKRLTVTTTDGGQQVVSNRPPPEPVAPQHPDPLTRSPNPITDRLATRTPRWTGEFAPPHC